MVKDVHTMPDTGLVCFTIFYERKSYHAKIGKHYLMTINNWRLYYMKVNITCIHMRM